MNRLARFLVYLYPSRWRKRYELELKTLVEDAGTRPIDLLDLFTGAFKMHFGFWKVPMALTFAGLAIAMATVEFVPKKYVAESAIRLSEVSPNDAVKRALTRSALVKIIHAEGLYKAELARLPVEDVVEMCKRNVSITAAAGDGTTKVAYVYPDEDIARRTVLRIAAAMAEPGPVTTGVIFPNHRNFILTGAMAGLLIGLAFSRFRRRQSNS